MNNGIKFIFSFSIGAAVSAVVTWKILKTKYEQIMQQEIEEVREIYNKKMKELASENEVADSDEVEIQGVVDLGISDKEVEQYETIADTYKKGGIENMSNEPYLITSEEFDELGYDTYTMTYYADGVLTDEYDNQISNPKKLVGADFAKYFTDHDYDVIYIRNDVIQRDYEILTDPQKFSDLYLVDEE